MLSHKDLWVIAGTTAPVVALAAIVSLTDALRENGDSINAGVRIQLDDIEEHYRAVDIAIKPVGIFRLQWTAPTLTMAAPSSS